MSQDTISFETQAELEDWLRRHHATQREAVVKLYKKNSRIPSITWDDMVECCLCWGWIDGVKRSLDAVSYTQRITPRKPRSSWSKRNVEIVERLVREGRMQPAGLAHVEAAKSDGRWAAAYAGPAGMVIPEDFLAALDAAAAARATYDGLTKSMRFAIYLQLHSARKPETRAARMARMIDRMARGEPPVKG